MIVKSMNTEQLADRLGISHRTLERWRLEGVGPIYRKLGRRVVYLESDIQSWIDEQARRSTSDDGTSIQRAA